MNSNGATSRLMPEAAPDAENVTVEIARFVVRRVDGVGNGVKQAQQYPCHNECLSEWGYGIEINAGGGNLKRGKEYGRCNENGAGKRACNGGSVIVQCLTRGGHCGIIFHILQ